LRFKVAARTVLELGAELISSDAIAIYELVKNAFDAGSKNVKVVFSVILKRSDYEKLRSDIDAGEYSNVEEVKKELRRKFLDDVSGKLAREFLDKLTATTLTRLLPQLDKAYETVNSLEIIDEGSGMSADILESAFLTLGTPHRLLQRDGSAKSRTVLGEKGVGRLSSMRLGSKLEIVTTEAGSLVWNVLNLDWTEFDRDPSRLIEDIQFSLEQPRPKTRSSIRGTRLRISGLLSDWDMTKLQDLAAGEFSRLMDPFQAAEKGFPLILSFNGSEVNSQRISKQLFAAAHGYCSGTYKIKDGKPRLEATFQYRLYSEEKTFVFEGPELRDIVAKVAPPSALISLGEFSFEFYWFNRRLLHEIDGIGKLKVVRDLVNHWTGGLMVFRNGFRVNPYGGKNDDWLDLNTQAFKSSGYLLNTDQILGRIEITGAGNPRLVDQTNREGLRDTFEKAALVQMMHYFVTVPLKIFMDEVVNEYKGLANIDLDDIATKVESYERRVTANIRTLRARFPGEKELIDRMAESFDEMKVAFQKARGAAEKADIDRQRMVELAGVGLLVEVVAHELARATKHTLLLIRQPLGALPAKIKSVFANLEIQISTIDRRLRILDVLSVSGRDRKSEFDLLQLIQEAFDSQSTQLSEAEIEVKISAASKTVWIKAVKGQVLQIVENLLTNSVHWLSQARSNDRKLKPRIEVVVSSEHSGSFTFTDNGPGIAPRFREEVFGAFYTTRAGEGGKGLGLYIARENARYHGGDLYLLDDRTAHKDRLNTFQFVLEAAK